MLRRNSKAEPCNCAVPDLVITSTCPPLELPYSASKFEVSTRKLSIESRLGTIDVPMFTSSSASLPFTRKPFDDSRCPLIERLPGLASPEGGVEATPVIITAPGCAVFIGTIPGCTAIKSVKLRPFSGTSSIFFVLSVSPSCVLVVSAAKASAVTSTVSVCLAISRVSSSLAIGAFWSENGLRCQRFESLRGNFDPVVAQRGCFDS